MKQVKYNYYFSDAYVKYETGNNFTTDYDISIEEYQAHRLLEQLIQDFPEKAEYYVSVSKGYDCK